MPALAERHKAAPVGDREIDRCERARREDRACDDDAGGRLLQDHEIGADAQHRRLQQHPHNLRYRAETAANVACALIRRQELFVERTPARRNARPHAHGTQRLGIAPRGFRQRLPLSRQLGDGLLRPARHQLGQDGEADDHKRAAERGDAEPEMEQETDEDVERHPRQIEQRHRPGARQEAAHLVDVAQRQQSITRAAGRKCDPPDHRIDARAQALAKRAPDTDQDATAQEVEATLEGIQDRHHDAETNERRNAAAGQHPVVDLQHVERAGQIEDVDQSTRDPDTHDAAAAGAQRLRKLAARLRTAPICCWSRAHCRHFLMVVSQSGMILAAVASGILATSG